VISRLVGEPCWCATNGGVRLVVLGGEGLDQPRVTYWGGVGWRQGWENGCVRPKEAGGRSLDNNNWMGRWGEGGGECSVGGGVVEFFWKTKVWGGGWWVGSSRLLSHKGLSS